LSKGKHTKIVRHVKWPVKAYRNVDFLVSSEGRLVRLLAEYLEPQARFRKHQVRDTVVFFGSARIHPPEEIDAQRSALEENADGLPEEALQAAIEHLDRQALLSQYYADAAALAERLTRWSMDLPEDGRRFLVCSGGGPGIMEAANRGALEAGGRSVALNISLPMEQEGNAYQSPELAFDFHYFFMRKFWFVYLAKALVCFPGGWGTCDELFEVLTLIQTRKTAKHMPVVLYGSGYWNDIFNFEAFVRWGTISERDMDLFRVCDTVDEAFDYLTRELTEKYLRGQSPKK